MPTWLEFVLGVLGGSFVAGTACWGTARWFQSGISLLKERIEISEREADHLRRSRDEWQQLASEVIAENRSLRTKLRRHPLGLN